VVASPDEWQVLLKDRLPAYISWDHYEENLARLQQNRGRADTRGVAREGPALLTRRVVCAFCGRHMAVRYGDETHYAYERVARTGEAGVERRAVGAQSGGGRRRGSIHRVLLYGVQPEDTRPGHGALLPWPRLV